VVNLFCCLVTAYLTERIAQLDTHTHTTPACGAVQLSEWIAVACAIVRLACFVLTCTSAHALATMAVMWDEFRHEIYYRWKVT
jgi:hypothetical protein